MIIRFNEMITHVEVDQFKYRVKKNMNKKMEVTGCKARKAQIKSLFYYIL